MCKCNCLIDAVISLALGIVIGLIYSTGILTGITTVIWIILGIAILTLILSLVNRKCLCQNGECIAISAIGAIVFFNNSIINNISNINSLCNNNRNTRIFRIICSCFTL